MARVMKDPFQVVAEKYRHVGADMALAHSAFLGCLPERHIDDLHLTVGVGAVVRSGAVIYAGSRIGDRLNMGHNSIIREENVIGDDFSLWSNSTIDYGCVVGNRVKIHHNVYVAQYTILEDDVFLAPGVAIANDPHPGCEFSKKCMKGPTIKCGAQIGVNATILPFVTIGERALIGAGSVVTKDVPPGAVVVGNPARITGDIMALECVVDPKLTDHPYS
jgi:acetyltransferase-like isoleucine patch superfamily enzyme